MATAIVMDNTAFPRPSRPVAATLGAAGGGLPAPSTGRLAFPILKTTGTP
jgi:hypothetical protein